MTQKTAKKIGEAHAFAHVLADTFTNNAAVMTKIFGEHAENIVATASQQKADLEKIATETDMADIVVPKSEKTGNKIMGMGDTYVGDDWDDAAEVLEWMSFFVGGAIVHWQLITGSAQQMDHSEFKDVAQKGTDYYAGLMKQLREFALTIGKERAQS